MKVENTVFLSYRRTNFFIARSVYQDLRTNNYDVFLDYQNIDSGSFERVIVNQIAARAHFVVVLTPSALERCIDPEDWLRREIEHAIDTKRNIIPLMFENFSFEKAKPYLIDKLAVLPDYNAISVPQDYFEEAMARLRTRFLNKPLDVVLHPVSADEQSFVKAHLSKIDNQTPPTKEERGAESYFEQGIAAYESEDFEAALVAFNKSLEIYPTYAEAYHGRGLVYQKLDEPELELADYNHALEIEPQNHHFYYTRARFYHEKQHLLEAIIDYNKALSLNPASIKMRVSCAHARYERGDYIRAIADYESILKIKSNDKRIKHRLAIAKKQSGKQLGILGRIKQTFDTNHIDTLPETAQDFYTLGKVSDDNYEKIENFTEAIRLNPNLLLAYYELGVLYYHQSDFKRAVEHYSQFIELSPNEYSMTGTQRIAATYNNRGEAYLAAGKYQRALADFKKANELDNESEYIVAGLAITYYVLGKEEKAKELWATLTDKRYNKVAWVSNNLKWHENLTTILGQFLSNTP